MYQLKETLLKNIIDNIEYDDLEFILLDYNSQDNMQEWVKHNFDEFIATGKLVYYRTEQPLEFNHSHSKNLAFKLASGEIVCNIHADHFTGKGFAAFTNAEFQRTEDVFLTTIDYHNKQSNYSPANDVLGKICVKKSDFLRVGGFDERMQKYAFEDYDFANRLEMLSLKRVLIQDQTFLNYISHSEDERYSSDLNQIHMLFIRYITPDTSEAVLLFRNSELAAGILVDFQSKDSDQYASSYEKKSYKYEYGVREPGWVKGNWNGDINNQISARFVKGFGNGFELSRSPGEDIFIEQSSGAVYHHVTDLEIIKNLMDFRIIVHNRDLMEENLQRKHIRANNQKFGIGTVFKNFQSQASVIL